MISVGGLESRTADDQIDELRESVAVVHVVPFALDVYNEGHDEFFRRGIPQRGHVGWLLLLEL